MELHTCTFKITFNDFVYGSIPNDPQVLEKWIKTKANKTPAEGGPHGDEDSLEEKIQSLPEVENEEEYALCVFRRFENKPVLRDFQVKACLGHAASYMKLTKTMRGIKTILRDSLQVRPSHIPFMRSEQIITRVDGYHDFVGHVMTMQGRRSIIKRCEYIEKAQCTFTVLWVPGLLEPAQLEEILRFAGSFCGLGSQRRFEAGKFRIVSVSNYKIPLAEVN